MWRHHIHIASILQGIWLRTVYVDKIFANYHWNGEISLSQRCHGEADSASSVHQNKEPDSCGRRIRSYQAQTFQTFNRLRFRLAPST
jgi:hypothetical protein